jgi:hypothetical protein
VSPVRYELGFYIQEDDILHSHRREKLKSYKVLTGWPHWRKRNVSCEVRFRLLYITEDGGPHSHHNGNLKF